MSCQAPPLIAPGTRHATRNPPPPTRLHGCYFGTDRLSRKLAMLQPGGGALCARHHYLYQAHPAIQPAHPFKPRWGRDAGSWPSLIANRRAGPTARFSLLNPETFRLFPGLDPPFFARGLVCGLGKCLSLRRGCSFVRRSTASDLTAWKTSVLYGVCMPRSSTTFDYIVAYVGA